MKWRMFGFLSIGLGAGLLLSAIILWSVSQGLFQPRESAAAGDNPRTGSAAPDFSLTTLNGRSVQLSQFRGKPVMINFWATWCDPCKEEMPVIQSAADKYQSKLVVLGINDDEAEDQVSQFITQYKIGFPILMDPGAKITDLYQIRGFPTSIFIDPDGKIQAIQIGSLNAEQLIGYLSRIGVLN